MTRVGRSTIDEFLRTGLLRGITAGTSVQEIGMLIGPPLRWGGDNWERNVPLCWYYEDVEILFDSESTPIISQLTINDYRYPCTSFKSAKLIRNIEGEPYPGMTFDNFLRYAKTHEHQIAEYHWSFQDAEEQVLTVNDKIWVSFRQYHDHGSSEFFPQYDESVEFKLVRIGMPLDGLWEFYKDPRSSYYEKYRSRLQNESAD